MERYNKYFGTFSAVATYALCVLAVYYSGVAGLVLNELSTFFSGDVYELTPHSESFLTMFAVMLAVVVLELPLSIGVGYLVEKTVGEAASEPKLENFFRDKPTFSTFFGLVVIEELFARWFFLGLLTKFSWFSGPLAFYFLLITGNAAWALIHLSNYSDEQDQHPLRVLPQFVGGFFLSYIFVKYGLIATVLTHFAYNAILFACHKVGRLGWHNALAIVYFLVCMGVSYHLMTKPLSSIAPWFYDNPSFALTGWEFWDYVKMSVFVNAFLAVLFSLMLYDGLSTNRKPGGDGPVTILEYVLAIFVVVAMYFIMYAILGLFIKNLAYRALVLAILIACFASRGSTGSAIARAFWTSVPMTYIGICILQALGFWASLALVAVEVVIYLPTKLIPKSEDQ